MKAFDILEFIGERIDLMPEAFPDGGFCSGGGEDSVRGVLVTWMATSEALTAAVERGCNVVVCHEMPFFSEVPQGPIYRWTSPPNEVPSEQDGHPNKKRKRIIADGGLTVLQIHYALDRLCIFDDFAKLVGLGSCVAGGGYEKVYQLPTPMTLDELAGQVGRRLSFDAVRIVGNPAQTVYRTGNLWGGVGLSGNRYWMRRLIEFGAQALVCGEADEMAMFFAREYGVGLVVTAHAVSENPGLRHFTNMLRERFPGVPVEFFEVQNPFSQMPAISGNGEGAPGAGR